MNGNRSWLGWIAIGLGALALLVALNGGGFGWQGASSFGGPNVPQAYTQQSAAPQSGQAAPGTSGQLNAGRQRGGPQSSSSGPGADQRRGAGRPGDGGFGLGRWLQFPFRLLGGSFNIGMLALLIVIGVLLLRGRGAAPAANAGRAGPAQGPSHEPPSPTGESYTEESSDPE